MMRIKIKILLIAAGLIVGIGLKFLASPYLQMLGADLIPPLPIAKSARIPSSYSDKDAFSHIDQQVVQFLNKWKIPGASVAIGVNGRLVFAKGYGYADLASQVAVEPYHLFRVASISKLITAVGIMKLVDEGEISLTDKVFGPEGILYMPPFNNYLDSRVEEIQVIHLLNHSGGWTNRWGDPVFMPHIIAKELGVELPVSDEEIISFMLGKRMHFVPGSMSSYSNLGYLILGRVIEEVTGREHDDFIRQRVLFPLGIFDMQVGRSFLHERANLEVLYYEHYGQLPVEDFLGNGTLVPISYGGNDIYTLGAAGGWIASATDLLRLMFAIDGHDTSPDVLSPNSINLMTTPVGEGFQPLGWRSVNPGFWERTGTLSGTSTLMVHRADSISYVVLLNGSTWKGPMLSDDIRQLMDRVISRTNFWPEHDLFSLIRD